MDETQRADAAERHAMLVHQLRDAIEHFMIAAGRADALAHDAPATPETAKAWWEFGCDMGDVMKRLKEMQRLLDEDL